MHRTAISTAVRCVFCTLWAEHNPRRALSSKVPLVSGTCQAPRGEEVFMRFLYPNRCFLTVPVESRQTGTATLDIRIDASDASALLKAMSSTSHHNLYNDAEVQQR
jgi:hypothetical protein